jgi:hypothetical protein
MAARREGTASKEPVSRKVELGLVVVGGHRDRGQPERAHGPKVMSAHQKKKVLKK